MGLISPRNFLAPFQSKVNLVTLLLVALVFFVLRVMGGSLVISENGREADKMKRPPAAHAVSHAESASEPAEESDESPFVEPARQDPQPVKRALQPAGDNEDESIDDLLRKEKPAGGKDRQPAEAPKEASALDDIEKSLGLR